jgi:hypothetical protein
MNLSEEEVLGYPSNEISHAHPMYQSEHLAYNSRCVVISQFSSYGIIANAIICQLFCLFLSLSFDRVKIAKSAFSPLQFPAKADFVSEFP